MIYSETTIFDDSFDCNSMEVGDSFHMNDTLYTIERKFKDGPFMYGTAEALTLFVVSFPHEAGKGYQVCTWLGDWEGCHPCADSIENALFSELARLNELEQQAPASTGFDPITDEYLKTGKLPGEGDTVMQGFNTSTALYHSPEEAIAAAKVDIVTRQGYAKDSEFLIHMYGPNLLGLIATVGTTEDIEIFSVHNCGGGYTYDAIP